MILIVLLKYRVNLRVWKTVKCQKNREKSGNFEVEVLSFVQRTIFNQYKFSKSSQKKFIQAQTYKMFLAFIIMRQ